MSIETFSRYDSADYLKTEEDIAAYLEAILEEGGDDPALIAHAPGVGFAGYLPVGGASRCR